MSKEEQAVEALQKAMQGEEPQVDQKDIPDEEINLLEYVYAPQDKLEIPAKLLEGLMQILSAVKDNETNIGYISNKPKSLKGTEVEWEMYKTAEEYFSQKPQEIRSQLGVYATDLEMVLKGIHLDNIRTGLAKKVGTVNKPEIKL